MKSLEDIRAMIEAPVREHRILGPFETCQILRAMLDHITLLDGRTLGLISPSIKELLARENSPVDYTKPHKFDLQKETGMPHVEYKICKCGLSERNAIHV